ncbi:hypothetical protein GCM10023208_20190 [Erythrobacter westpacificensis]|uniref:Uncharacterized protein n=1 Tax=Erythrobacter westpacificensis TaxID=1055231 RepID=A0ABP9KFS2_9SPHN
MSSSNGSGGEAIVPLAPDLWFGRLRTLAKRLKDDEARLEEALRHAYHLTQMAPGPFNEIVECKTAEEV